VKPLTQSRRRFLQSTAAVGAAASAPYFFTGEKLFAQGADKNDRPIMGCIGTGSRWNAVGGNAMRFADCVAVCDVDANHADKAAAKVENVQGKKPQIHEDYQKILDNKDIDVVTIVTPDHWHTKIAIEALKAGKDVYCEKPLTLTIEEGKLIDKVVKETGRVFQVGTQQRSEMGLMFLKAVALCHAGRLGDIKHIHVAIGGSPTSGPIPVADVPKGLNWEKWLGQTPLVDYRYKPGGRWGKSRCHYEFRWWYEYSGGKLTDWGAHHVDIAQWGIDQNGAGEGPTTIEPVMAKHPVEFKDGYPTDETQYNCATHFRIKVTFPGDTVMEIRESCPDKGFSNGIMFEGTRSRILVNRGRLVGAPVEELKKNPLPEGILEKLYKGKTPGGGNAHMRNFFECVKDRGMPVSDVFTHNRALTTCHLSNIAIRLGRTLKWDPKTQQIVGDDQANAWQSRKQREGYEIEA